MHLQNKLGVLILLLNSSHTLIIFLSLQQELPQWLFPHLKFLYGSLLKTVTSEMLNNQCFCFLH